MPVFYARRNWLICSVLSDNIDFGFKTSSICSLVMPPYLKITNFSPRASTTVDSRPIAHCPPSKISGILPFKSSYTSYAVVGLGLDDVLADGAAIGVPTAFKKRWRYRLVAHAQRRWQVLRLLSWAHGLHDPKSKSKARA